ncbi:hypothetical protein XU18_0347 [Perkinsela sp. CCAP 1560/4]|nr:hypothetical protein XU18_0347 [Perkinsela sp. CCAP 1560/4]|eukprot:KNH09662.1 hypothetical protein XU18_0347 [Perkinsela sp. CCAP 1560/4]
MLRRCFPARETHYIPPIPGDTKISVPPPVPSETGGPGGVSIRYSERLCQTPLWKRYAVTTYAERMLEARSTYPYSEVTKGDYDTRFLPKAFKDQLKYRPLSEIGQSPVKVAMKIPVILLAKIMNTNNGIPLGEPYETVWVNAIVMRAELVPRRLAVYATAENYELLGLTPIDHHIHEEIPRDIEEKKRLLLKNEWEEEPWKYSFEYMYRNQPDTPEELLPSPDGWEGLEEAADQTLSSEDGTPIIVKRHKERKAKKINIFA